MDYLTLSLPLILIQSSFKISNISTTAVPDKEDHLPDQRGLLDILLPLIKWILETTMMMMM